MITTAAMEKDIMRTNSVHIFMDHVEKWDKEEHRRGEGWNVLMTNKKEIGYPEWT